MHTDLAGGVEELAKCLCEERWGKGSFHDEGRQRSYWRRQARKQIREAGESQPSLPDKNNFLLED